jgi:two-component system cell cycle sensor histidine kinase/response regulator CckA
MKLRILHVEDSVDDSEIVHRILRGDGIDCEIERRETRAEFIENIRSQDYDLILADCTLPNFSGLHALALAHQYAPETPFIFVSGTIGEEIAIESLRNGATDYVLKNQLSRLPAAVRRSIQEVEQRERNRDMERRLQQAQNLKSVGTLAGGIAHDFNNLLTIIKGHASLLKRECETPARVREISAIIDHAAVRGSDLVREMLAFARESGGIFALADFNHMVRESAGMMRAPLGPRISLELALDESLPPILVDTGQVERIIINLIANARDALPHGGRIVVSTGRVTESSAVPCLKGLPLREYAYLQVTDNGTGMTEETRSRIFEPFFTTKARGSGTGLGLPVVYGVMQMHHGAIEVTSAPGQGTTVELYFPLITAEENPRVHQPPAAPRATRGSETLLVVDDEPDVLSFLRLMLEAEGYRVLTAANAEEALALFGKHRDEIQLLFSDLGLPTLSGYDLSEILQRLRPGMKCVLGSGYADAEVREHLHDAGFIAKPYTPETTLATIRAALDDAPETIKAE